MDLITFFILVFIIEGYTDFNIIKSSNQDKSKEIRNWHKSNFISWILIVSLICYLKFGISWQALMNLSFIGLIRNFFLNTTLNLFRGKNVYYLGTKGIDKLLKPIEKLWWVLSLLVIIFICITVYIVK